MIWWFGATLVVISWSAGIWMGVIWTATDLELKRVKHKAEMDDAAKEIKRLRAQNAMLIGKE